MDTIDLIEKRRAQRFLYLKRPYQLVGTNKLLYPAFSEIGHDLGWDDQTCDDVTEYLREEGLIDFPTFGTVSITHHGIKAIESALSNPDQRTDYFPSASTTIVVNRDFIVGGDVIGRDNTSNA